MSLIARGRDFYSSSKKNDYLSYIDSGIKSDKKPELVIACHDGKTIIDNAIRVLKSKGYMESIRSNQSEYGKVMVSDVTEMEYQTNQNDVSTPWRQRLKKRVYFTKEMHIETVCQLIRRNAD